MVDFTSQAMAERFETVREVVVALVKMAPVVERKVDVAEVKLARAAKRFVLVAFVEVEKLVVRAAIEEEAAMRPPLKVSIVVVALFGKRYAKVEPASVPQLKTPVADAFTSQATPLRLETTRSEVDAPALKLWRAVKTFAVYVFGIVVEECAK